MGVRNLLDKEERSSRALLKADFERQLDHANERLDQRKGSLYCMLYGDSFHHDRF